MTGINRRGFLASSACVAVAGLLPGCATLAPSPLFPPFPTPRVLAKPPGTVGFAPPAPVYPVWQRPEDVTGRAQILSDALTAHIRAWAAGNASAELPADLVPPGTDLTRYRNFTLRRPEEMDAADQWAIRPSEPTAVNGKYRGLFPDPNCTYLVVPSFLAPYGARLTIEGEFPRARFFDIQVTPSLDPRSYRYEAAGVGEVPIVDVDIDPLPGHSNPFRPGARRDVTKRSYRVEYDLAMGDPVALNPAFRPPHFRAPGNRRTGGALMFRGPWGIGAPGGDGRGPFASGEIWVRYYRPDRIEEPLAGVPLPRLSCTLASGERFWIEVDTSGFEAFANRRARPRATSTSPTVAAGEGPADGWYKMGGIWRAVIAGTAKATNWAGKDYVRALDKGVSGRGSDLPPPNNYEQSATSATYIDYLVRGMACAEGHVVVLTGRLPTFPDTARRTVMDRAEMRYWSMVGYAVPEGLDFLAGLNRDSVVGAATHAIRDDELVLDDDRFYVIALSRPADRPANATREAGISWVDWGPAGKVSWTNRWLSVGPEWKGNMIPTPEKLGTKGEWAEPAFDPSVISRNGWSGVLGAYLPRVGYMRKAAFEALGPRITARAIPDWTELEP
jgi:hypothetical protein